MIKLKSLKPNPGNPRIIKDEKFFQLVQSIQDFPQMMKLRPLVVDEHNVVLGGNMRLRALQHLNYKEIDPGWVIKASELTEEQKREFMIRDNVHQGTWETEALANTWDQEQLSNWGVDIASWNMMPPPPGGTGDESEGGSTAGTRKPSPTDDEFSVFELVMLHENKKLLLEKLNEIKSSHQLDKLEEALMYLVNTFKI